MTLLAEAQESYRQDRKIRKKPVEKAGFSAPARDRGRSFPLKLFSRLADSNTPPYAHCPGLPMNRQQVIEVARNFHVNEKYFYKSSIKSLIWKIQEAQGRTPCYLKEERFSCKADCQWSRSCKKLTAAWLR